MHTWRQDAALHDPLNHTAVRNHRTLDPCIRTDARGGALFGPGEDQPIALIQVKLGLRLKECHVRVEVCGEGPHVLPVAPEAVGHHLCATGDHGGQHVGTEVGTSLIKPCGQRIGGEGVDPHAGETTGRSLRLLLKSRDATPLVCINDPHAARIIEAHLAHGDGYVGTTASMGGEEALVVHLVDVVAGEHENGIGAARHHFTKVLQYRVRRAAVPVSRIAAANLRLKESHAADRAVEIPRTSASDMVGQRPRVVLREHEHIINAAVDAV